MSLKYRAEINGLRALAIIPVILFHADFEIFKKGYLGVDIFFVISGYLITTLILQDLINNNFSIKYFFERRARRILPALYFIMFITIPFAWILLSRNELGSYLKSLTAIIFFLSNFFFWTEIPYFANEASLKPLLHTWSLSIEEQFYIIFSFLLIFIYNLNKHLLIYLFGIIFVLSLSLFFYGSNVAPNANFYFTFTRAWQISIGVIIAYFIINNRFNLSKLSNDILSLFGILIIFYSFFFDFYLKEIPAALLSTMGAALIIIFGNKDTLVGKFLSINFFVGIGFISYSLYLWHYPIFAFAKNYFNEINLQLKFFLILLSLILSIFSYKIIEKPFRNNNFIDIKNFIKLIFFLSLFLFFFSISTFYYFSNKGSDEIKMAKLLTKNKAVYSTSMDERIFIKNRIIYEDYNPKILVIGSSRVMQLGENELKKKTLNLSVSGASIEDQIAITEMALEKFNPTIIYLAADPWLFNQHNNQKRWKSIKADYNNALFNINLWSKDKINFNKIKLINEDKEILNINLSENILEKVFRKINLNSNFIIPTNIKPTDNKSLILRDGKRVYDLKYQNQKIKKDILIYSNMKNYEYSSLYFENYDNFISYLKNYHKKEVILILSPYYKPSFELTVKEIPSYLEIENKFINLADKHKIKILGSYDPKLVNCKNNEFYDSMHPKDSCMQKLVREN
jgi:peptidoglycan/LPS O-acetylase OafA/YrhL